MLTSGDTAQEGLEAAIYNTVRYFDLFDQPVTATHLWRSLIVPHETAVRWNGRRGWRLKDIRVALQSSSWLQERLGSQWGYYFLTGRGATVATWLERHRLAQQKWKITERVARWLAMVPLVRMMAMSGSLAAANTRPGSDLDIFVVVAAGRIWTARLLLLLVAQLTGRRRRYWDEEAPDKICLNHYITDESLAIDPEIRNVYTAVLYRHLVPLTGLDVYEQFETANGMWLKRFLMYPETPLKASRQLLPQTNWRLVLKRQLEGILTEPFFDWVEHWSEVVQRRIIRRHTRLRQGLFAGSQGFGGQVKSGQGGRVVLSDKELAFHPDTKVPGILERFAQEAGQKKMAL